MTLEWWERPPEIGGIYRWTTGDEADLPPFTVLRIGLGLVVYAYNDEPDREMCWPLTDWASRRPRPAQAVRRG